MECPICHGEMWDNRPKKQTGEFSAKSPDFKCKDKNCKGVVWPPKEGEQITLSPEIEVKKEQIRKELASNRELSIDINREWKIQRQHSQEMALRAINLFNPPLQSDNEFKASIIEWTDWFMKDLEK